ncbi:transcriptional regulator, XRE family [Paenibacillus curdlanolyticus YK9]|uniref:Transcriptional regulator, XRE family n=1 Tax=Paenibacillus curdlanolyticus YK9 TaxID=717606 RepID=E0IBV5_9BACL|nr:helix-turn-helix transcriptional regulator [Paenibacillus curdlanolyticus]EFM10185.1 transcriptional regulator, XRE family [Paenibacillus curdlanolyticus YK9]
MIKSNLKQLIDGRGLSVRQVAKDIEYRLGSVQDLYNDTTERFPRELLDKLCRYFECSIADLLTYEEAGETKN